MPPPINVNRTGISIWHHCKVWTLLNDIKTLPFLWMWAHVDLNISWERGTLLPQWKHFTEWKTLHTVEAIIICAGNLLLPTKCHHPNLQQTNIQLHCLLGEKREYPLARLTFLPGRLGVQPKTYLGMWTAELIPLGDEFQIPGWDCGIGPE